MIPLLAEHGIEWIATDEEILGCSTHGLVGRDSRGHVRNPERLYRPWKVREGESRAGDRLPRPLDVRPGRLPLPAQPRPGRGRPTSWARSTPSATPAGTPSGDPRPGHPRRRELLGVLPRRRRLVPPLALPGRGPRPEDPAGPGRRVPRASTRRGADTVPRLFAGSWISHNFAIWIGHPEDNRGWDALHAAREFLVAEERSGRHDALVAGEGLGGDLHRRGLRLVLVVRRRPLQRPGRTVRPPVPQAPAQRLHAAGLRPAGLAVHADLARRRPSSAPRPADQLPATSRSTAAPPTSSGSTPRGTPAATTAGR